MVKHIFDQQGNHDGYYRFFGKEDDCKKCQELSDDPELLEKYAPNIKMFGNQGYHEFEALDDDTCDYHVTRDFLEKNPNIIWSVEIQQKGG